MRTIAHSPAGRKAFGPQRHRSASEKARHIAESILLHAVAGHTRTLADYGMADNTDQAALVTAALVLLRAQMQDTWPGSGQEEAPCTLT